MATSQAPTVGWLISDEPITFRTRIAFAIIVTAVVLITLAKNKLAPT
jgi:drug/metabolite transporter (DMT)-like permease